jgi:NADPH:quinone reductase-like Zn-dependent oxidoreductase
VRDRHYNRENNEVVELPVPHQSTGKVRVNVNQRFALKDAADAHKALEARATSDSTILTI